MTKNRSFPGIRRPNWTTQSRQHGHWLSKSKGARRRRDVKRWPQVQLTDGAFLVGLMLLPHRFPAAGGRGAARRAGLGGQLRAGGGPHCSGAGAGAHLPPHGQPRRPRASSGKGGREKALPTLGSAPSPPGPASSACWRRSTARWRSALPARTPGWGAGGATERPGR